MANQTITTAVNYDSTSIRSLLNGETITINGGSLTIDADVRYNQQAAVFGNITVSSTLGGVVEINGTQVWEVPFSSSTGNVPTQSDLGSNIVTGDFSGATGELTRVWATGSFNPAGEGEVMPSTGFIKLRNKTGNFISGETITLPNGSIVTASSEGQRSWIHVVGASGSTMLTPRMANVTSLGDWYEVGTTDGTDNQTIQMPVRDEFPAIQIETEVGSGVYEWWANAADSWNGLYPNTDQATVTNATLTRNAIAGPANYPAAERLRETAVAGVHSFNGQTLQALQIDVGSYTHSAIVKSETRQWCVVQISTFNGGVRFGALVDLVAGTIIATPTVGSPTGTSSSITSLGNGWYEVSVTMNHINNTNLTSFVATADSATPTYSNGLPTYTGNTAQGIYVGFWTVIQNTYAFVPTDVRGKFFYSDPFFGTIQLAKRGTNNAGFKPVSGLKIRIPNVILGTSTAADYAAQYVSYTARYNMNIAGGVYNQDTVTFNWQVTNVTPITFTLKNSAYANWVSILNFYTEIRNSCFAPILYTNASNAPITLQNSVNLYLYNSRIVRQSGNALSTTLSSNINAYNSRFENIRQLQGRSQRTASSGTNPSAVSIVSSGGEFNNCTVVNGGLTINAQNYNVLNLTYCDNINGTTPAIASRAVAVQGDNIVINGILALAEINNNHPYAEYINVNGFVNNLTIRNIGSSVLPINAGTVNPCGSIITIASSGTTFELRRCYITNLRSSPMVLVASAPVVNIYDVWSDGTSSQTISTGNAVTRGGRWTNSRAGTSGNQGTHWDDAFNSTTTGRITIMANEPTTTSAAQCSATLGLGSGFNGSGSMIISRLTDVVNWATPLKIYGHNFLAGGCALSGTDCQNLIFEYKIDTGLGFGGSWAFLANTVRRASGGTIGTNTVTVTAADRTSLTRQPQVGDFVQSSLFKLPANTTVTNVSGNIITCSNNFTVTLSTNEFVTFSPVNVAVNATNGYSLQVRTYPTVAAPTTLLTAFSMGIQTNAIDQQIQHPLPAIELTLTGIVSGSDIVVLQAGTETILNQIDQNIGSSWIYDYEIPNVIDIFVSKAGYVPFYIRNYTLSTTNGTLPIKQVIDRNYTT